MYLLSLSGLVDVNLLVINTVVLAVAREKKERENILYLVSFPKCKLNIRLLTQHFTLDPTHFAPKNSALERNGSVRYNKQTN
jgi:hypothetical protein